MIGWFALALLLGAGATAGPARAESAAPPLTPTKIIDPTRQLARFAEALARVKAGKAGAIVRIAQYGDSITSNDAITRRARERLQTLFGDGGAGFVPAGLPSDSYRHHTVLRTGKGWKTRAIQFGGLADKRYGVGGASFEGGSGAQASFTTTKSGLGSKVSRYDVYYLAQPGAGKLEVTLDGKPHSVIDTAATEIKSGFTAIDVPDGAHKLQLRVIGGKVRLYGVVMERPGPGVTFDNFGLASNSAKALGSIRPDHLREQHDHRGADLIIIYLGANEADWYPPGEKSIAAYQEVYASTLGALRAAAPKASCLVMSPTDAANFTEGKLITKAVIPGLVEAQRKAAAAKGCAFWDAFTWMGGKGSVRKWRLAGQWEPDLTHPNGAGAAKVADGLVDALLEAAGVSK